MIFTWPIGLRLKKQKNLLELPIEVMPPVSFVFIHFQQHRGKPAIPLVKKGDAVKIGSKIGETGGEISSPVHSSVSGRVIDIKPHPHPFLREGLCCVIESDYSDTWEQRFIDSDYHSLSKEELLERIEKAGVVGLGGGGYPTAKKLLAGMKDRVNLLIINGCESEPNLAADYRVMIEYTASVVEGARILQKILNVPKMIFVLTRNYKMAEALLKKEGADVKILPDSYPVGSERVLIRKITKITLPADKLPIDVGIIVQNVSTCYAVFQAVKYNKPLIERVITISGDGINKPKNILVKIGTPLSAIIQYCEGLKDDLKKIIFGGLMTGIAQFSLDTPVIKTTSGIVFQSAVCEDEINDCVYCGKCIDVCPMGILPQMIYTFIKNNEFKNAIDYGLDDCIECGCCSYVCPSSIPLVHYFKYARLRNMHG